MPNHFSRRRSARYGAALGLLALLALVLIGQSSHAPGVLQSPAHLSTRPSIPATRVIPNDSMDSAPHTIEAQAFATFDSWADAVRDQQQPLSSAELAAGLELAKSRRAALANLIEADPQQALDHAVPYDVRAALPPAIQDQLEQQVDGRGDFRVAIGTPFSGQTAQTFRSATVNGKTYKAFVYGRRQNQPCKSDIPLHGIAIGDSIALHESPIRVLAKGELPDPAKPVLNEDLRCPVSGIVSREVTVDAGGVIIYLCCAGHIGPIEKKLADGETLQTAWGTLGSSSTVAATSGPLQSAWTTGVKNLILMRVDFSDAPVASTDTTYNATLVTGLNTFYTQSSYGATGFNAVGSGSDITPIMRMPQTFAYYSGNNFYDQLRADAKTAAAAAGYTLSNYQLDVTCMSSGSGGSFSAWAGLGYVGASGAWIRSASTGVPAHELGHNYGLWHANYWNTTSDSIIGPGSNLEYGNQYDTMGSANAGIWQFNAYEKNLLQWLPDTNVTTVTANGTYRILPFDNFTLSGTNSYALVVRRDSTRNYWCDLRQLFTSNNWEMNGSELLWSPWANSNNGSQLLDTTPSSPNGRNDAAITVGRTFADTNANVYITTIAKNASPASLDIVVNTGTFPGNHAPALALSASATSIATNTSVNLTATANDADGDTLAYYWEYGDGTYSINNVPVETKSWAGAGEYRVRCTVSDMKGGSTSESIIITVGSPTTFRLSGTVTLGGAPLAGVRVTDSSAVAYTDSDGTYTLVGETAGSKTITATIFDCAVTPTFTNPVTVSGSMTGLNFTATQNTYKISGTVTDGAAGVSGVTITDGTHTAVTDASGNYALTGLTNAYYTLTAIKQGYQFSAGAPVEILGANATQNFTRQLWNVSGTISGVNAAPVVDIGDGVHTATATVQGSNYFYSLQVPAGTWNLKATLAGYTISPSNFTDPLNVSASLNSKNFTGVSGTTYTISGNITAGSTPLPGVVVSTGAKSSTADTLGNYSIAGLANGTYTITPTYSGATFTPVNASVTVSSANVTGKNFVATYPLTITTSTPLPLGVIGIAYSQTLNAVSGQTPYTWSITAGALPAGIALNPAGVISGTPGASGTFNFTLKVTDNVGATASKVVALTINPALNISTASTLSAPMGSAFSLTLSAAGGLPPYQFWGVASGTLPTGLTLSSSTGVLSGTPSATGVYNFSVYVYDSTFAYTSKAFTMTITRVGIDTTSLPQGTANSSYSVTLSASNGATPYTWSLSSGSLPTGLTLSPAGVISGTPTVAATSGITVKVSDKGSITATQALSLTINPALVITTTALPAFDPNVAYTQTLASTGGTAPVSWSILSGSPPAGISLKASGVLSGTPTNGITGTFVAQVSDAAGAHVSRTLVLVANAPLAILSTSLPTGVAGSNYAAGIDQSGGKPPFTWSVSSGALPDGLSISNITGALSGTPTTAGTSNFTVSVQDSAGTTVSQAFALTIKEANVAPVVNSGISATPAQPNVGDSVAFTVGISDPNGDSLTYAWDFGDGGADISASPSHTFTTAGTYTIQVTATDPDGLSVSTSLSLTVSDPLAGSGLPPGTILMTVSKITGSAKFNAGGHDTVTFSGRIPNVPQGFDPAGKMLSVNYAGAVVTFTLTSKGTARSANGSVALKLKPSLRAKGSKVAVFQGGNVAFQIKLTNGSWAAAWGMDPAATTPAAPKTMTATIQLDSTLYGAVSTVSYSSKANVSAKFKK